MSAKLPSSLSEKAFPIEQLISAPIRAIIEAQSIATQSVLDFISEVAFEPISDSSELKNGTPKLKTVEFVYSHPIPDPDNPGMVIDTPSKVSIPLLAMLQIPNISISESTLDFNINIVGLPENKEKTKSSNIKTRLPFIIQSRYASRIQATNDVPQESHTLSLSIKLKKEESPEAQRKIMSLLDEAIISHPIEFKRPKKTKLPKSSKLSTKTKSPTKAKSPKITKTRKISKK